MTAAVTLRPTDWHAEWLLSLHKERLRRQVAEEDAARQVAERWADDDRDERELADREREAHGV